MLALLIYLYLNHSNLDLVCKSSLKFKKTDGTTIICRQRIKSYKKVLMQSEEQDRKRSGGEGN